MEARYAHPEKSRFNGKGKIAWKNCTQTGGDWTARPSWDQARDPGTKIPLYAIMCPRCAKSNTVRGRALTNPKGGWNLIMCSCCQAAYSAKDWTCSCGKAWHSCDVHYFQSERKGRCSKAKSTLIKIISQKEI